MTNSIRNGWALRRLPLIGGLLAAWLLLAACATPSTFPQGNNATCWTKQRENTKDTPTCEEPSEKWTDWGNNVWTWSLCNSGGLTIYEMKYDAGQCQTYQTTLINQGHGDTYAQVYFGQDEAGYPALNVYCVNPGRDNTLAITVRWDFGANYSAPDSNTLLTGVTGVCAVPVKVYLLTTGEFAVHIGPDDEGKVAAAVFNAPPVSNLRFVDLVASD